MSRYGDDRWMSYLLKRLLHAGHATSVISWFEVVYALDHSSEEPFRPTSVLSMKLNYLTHLFQEGYMRQ